eukprot:c21177_g1_i1 orf=413-1393(-)
MGCNNHGEKRAPSLASSIRNSLQETQSALNTLGQTLLHQIRGNPSATRQATSVVRDQQRIGDGNGNGNPGTEVKQNGVLHVQLETWKRNPSWTDHPPHMEVSAPKGTLCHIESTFQLGMPPDALYNIVTDPENKRVFKNIKEVTYRRVLEDEGHRQLVEVEQSAIWRFLCFSGTMSIRIFVDQNRNTHTLKFHLAKEGFMKKFEGTWDVKPVYVDSPHCELLESPEDDPVCSRSRIGSKVHFRQVLQPILVPPPPVAWYVRGISRRQTETLIEDLQAEAKRLREEGNERTLEVPQQQQQEEQEGMSSHGRHLSSRRRRRNTSWLRK